MALVVKNPFANAGDVRDAGLIPGSGISPGGGHGNPLQYSCPENPMDRGAWRGGAYGPWGRKESDTTEALGRTQLSTHTHTNFSICVSPNERGGKSRACSTLHFFYYSLYHQITVAHGTVDPLPYKTHESRNHVQLSF